MFVEHARATQHALARPTGRTKCGRWTGYQTPKESGRAAQRDKQRCQNDQRIAPRKARQPPQC